MSDPRARAYTDLEKITALHARSVAPLLGGSDRVGRPDFAILALLSRLGLHVVGVAALRLSDVGWRAGKLLIHGKDRHQERLPLPTHVGEALDGAVPRQRQRYQSKFRRVPNHHDMPEQTLARLVRTGERVSRPLSRTSSTRRAPICRERQHE